MGGSEYYNSLNLEGGAVPKSDTKILKNAVSVILELNKKGLIKSCHDVSEGGIAVCLSEMSIGGDLGCEINLTDVSKELRSDFKLFSESNTRWIVEVKKENINEFEKTLKKSKTYYKKIGKVIVRDLIIIDKNKIIISQQTSTLADIWKNSIWKIMG